MTAQQVSDRVLTVPNVVSFTRLAAIPVFWWLLLRADNVTAATILFALIATTDWIDGYLARRLDQVSKLGTALDPVADRLLIASGVIAGLIAGIVPSPIGLVLIAREIYMAIVSLFVFSRARTTLEVRVLGKWATFLVYSSIGWFYVAAIPFLEDILKPLAWIAGVVGLALYLVTAFQYTGDALRIVRELESTTSPEES